MSNIYLLRPAGSDGARGLPTTSKLGPGLFMGVIDVLLLLLCLAYLARTQVDDWQALAAESGYTFLTRLHFFGVGS